MQEDGSEPDARSLSRRDAAAFVRAVRRYGRPERLADVAAEVGRSLEEAGPGPRLSLWYSLMDGCRLAVQKTTEEQSEDAKVRGWEGGGGRRWGRKRDRGGCKDGWKLGTGGRRRGRGCEVRQWEKGRSIGSRRWGWGAGARGEEKLEAGMGLRAGA